MQLRLTQEESELSNVTFCVLDVETTGGSAIHNRITEIGAVKIRGGEVLGEFRTFVNAHHEIPPTIVVLTGITQSLLANAPTELAALASFLEFLNGATPVGHNVRFDLAFLNATAQRVGLEEVQTPPVDTLTLSRKLLSGEVPNHKLGTIAQYLRVEPRVAHRALDDARTTVDIFHCLLERAGTIGITHLNDLRTLQTPGLRAAGSKLRLTTTLPHRPGIYRFHDRSSEVIYVGTSTDIKTRVRSYFNSEQRRKVPRLLQETATISYVELECPLSAAILEVREIALRSPRFNARGTYRTPVRYLRFHPQGKLTVDTGLRTLESGSFHDGIGPFSSSRNAYAVRDLISDHGLTLALNALPRSTAGADHRPFVHEVNEIATILSRAMITLANRQSYERAEELRSSALRLLRLVIGAYLHRSIGRLPYVELTHHHLGNEHRHALIEGRFQLPSELAGGQSSPERELRTSGEHLIIRTNLLRGELTHEHLDLATVLKPLRATLNLFTPQTQDEPLPLESELPNSQEPSPHFPNEHTPGQARHRRPTNQRDRRRRALPPH